MKQLVHVTEWHRSMRETVPDYEYGDTHFV